MFALFFIANNAYAQNINNLRFWGSNNGLFNKIPHAITKDKNGYMWLGTQNGLTRFDGRTFIELNEIYPNDELAGAKINYLLIINDSTLWAGTNNGLFSINLYTYYAYKICLPNPNKGCTETYRVESLFKTKSGSILIGSSVGIVWLLENNKYYIISNSYNEKSTFEHIGKFTEAPNNKVWFHSGQKKIFCIDLLTKKTIDMQTFNYDVYKVQYIKNKGLLVNGEKGLFSFDTKSKKLSNCLTGDVKNLYDIIIESENSFWITHFVQGLYLYDNNKLKNYTSIFNTIGENNYRITSIFKDNNNIWIGTNFGLIKFTYSPSTIAQFLSSDDSESPFGGSVRGICELPNKSLLFATYKGLFKSAPPFKEISKVKTKIKFNIFPYALCLDSGVVWIGTEGTGLIKYTISTEKLEWISYFTNPEMEPRFITSITNDQENNRLLIGTYLGLIEYNKNKNMFKRISLDSKEKKHDQTTINQILRVNNTYWFASNLGLFITDKNLKTIATPTKLRILTHQAVTKIVYDSISQIFWIGTLGKGLWKYEVKRNELVNYNREKGLPNDNVVSIIAHSENSLLIGTYNGLCKLNPITGLMINLYTENGLSHNEFNLKAAIKTSDGLVFMGGLNGYNIIDNDIDKYTKLNKNEIFISKLYTQNGEEENTSYYTKNNATITLPPNNNNFDIEFGMSDYTQTENNLFRYKLEGKDKNWNYLNNRNYIRFNDLEPGLYKLLLKGTAANGNWTTDPFTINLIVKGYFYKTWWFIIFIFLIILSAIIGFYRFKLTQVKKLSKLRLQISSDLHDEVGSILTAVGMQAEMLRADDKINNQLALNKIAETSRTAVSNMRDVVWSIDSRNDKCSDLIDRMHEYISLVIDNEHIHCVFDKSIENTNLQLELVIRQNLYLIFKESINNIVKHANATKVNIHLKLNNKMVYLLIENNGKPCIEKGSGMGIKNMEMRANKMKAKLTIEQDNNYKLTLIKFF